MLFTRLLRVSPVRAITPQHYNSMLPVMITIRGGTGHDLDRVRRAKRKARGELLAEEDPTLRRCYDYLQDAEEHPTQTLFYLYKVIEAIKRRFPDWKKGGALKVSSEAELVNKLANEPERDERHAPEDANIVRTTKSLEKMRATEATVRIVRAYENYLIKAPI